MAIFLFTDFGTADLYVGQVKAILACAAPGVEVIDLLHEAPDFNVKASAHLLAALGTQIPEGSVTMAVVDPGVGTVRSPVITDIDGRYFVGPDNGLMSVLAARARHANFHRITWQPAALSASFHGRDLFAPVAAALARGDAPQTCGMKVPSLEIELGPDDLAEIIYVDHYGNAMTGWRAAEVSTQTRLVVGGHELAYRRVFGEAARGEGFWYANSLGLVEIAANEASAAGLLGLAIGDAVAAVA